MLDPTACLNLIDFNDTIKQSHYSISCLFFLHLDFIFLLLFVSIINILSMPKLCWLVFIFRANEINHVLSKSITTIQYEICWKNVHVFSSGRFAKRIRQPKLVLWHNSIVKTSNKFVIFVSYVMSLRVNASRFYDNGLSLFFLSPESTLCHAIYQLIAFVQKHISQLKNAQLVFSIFFFFSKAFFLYIHLIVLMHIRHMNAHLFSFCYIFNYNRFEHLFKAFQWRSISKATVWQNEFNANMRIHFQLNFFMIYENLSCPIISVFFYKHCHFPMPRTMHGERAKHKNIALKIYLYELLVLWLKDLSRAWCQFRSICKMNGSNFLGYVFGVAVSTHFPNEFSFEFEKQIHKCWIHAFGFSYERL